jgi:hypothetical protein
MSTFSRRQPLLPADAGWRLSEQHQLRHESRNHATGGGSFVCEGLMELIVPDPSERSAARSRPSMRSKDQYLADRKS